MTAEDVKDLFQIDDPFEQLWSALREHNLRPLKNRLAGEHPVDITLRARGGYLGITCQDAHTAQESRQPSTVEHWEFLQFSAARITTDFPGCLRQIGAALITLGGSVLNAPENR